MLNPGSVHLLGWALRLLSGLMGCVLIMRRLMAVRRLQTEDRVLANIIRRMDEIAEMQALLVCHLKG